MTRNPVVCPRQVVSNVLPKGSAMWFFVPMVCGGGFFCVLAAAIGYGLGHWLAGPGNKRTAAILGACTGFSVMAIVSWIVASRFIEQLGRAMSH